MVFVIGPNFQGGKAGRLATWPYQFVLDVVNLGLNVVQDAYWIKVCRIPLGQVRQGLMRDAVEWCVWIGPPDCYRDQKSVLWEYADSTKRLLDMVRRGKIEDVRHVAPSGISVNPSRFRDRGGSTPMNALATINAQREAMGHPAAFPESLAGWWVKYICPPRGIVMDPFAGSGTTCAVAAKLGRKWVGIEKEAKYARNARRRVTLAQAK